MKLLLATLTAAVLALAYAAVHALAHAVWAVINPELRADILRLNWAMIGTMLLLFVVIPALMAATDRER